MIEFCWPKEIATDLVAEFKSVTKNFVGRPIEGEVMNDFKIALVSRLDTLLFLRNKMHYRESLLGDVATYAELHDPTRPPEDIYVLVYEPAQAHDIPVTISFSK